jgi:hypothetical protein
MWRISVASLIVLSGVAVAQQDLSCPSTNTCSSNAPMLSVTNTSTSSGATGAYIESRNACAPTVTITNAATSECFGFGGKAMNITAATEGVEVTVTDSFAVLGNTSNGDVAVEGMNQGSGVGVAGYSSSGLGVYGDSSAADGVKGVSASMNYSGVFGENQASGVGVLGYTNQDGYAVVGFNDCTGSGCSGFAGYFFGRTHSTDDLSTSGSKPFLIDHPLDPSNRILMHAALEAPEVLNVYSGTVTIGKNGNARVQLPSYFLALNKGDYRYQLTCVGGYSPVYVAKEIGESAAFEVAGGVPGLKVSWQVLAVRNDPRMRLRPFVAEQDKAPSQRGKYFDPRSYGLGADKAIVAPVRQTKIPASLQRLRKAPTSYPTNRVK